MHDAPGGVEDVSRDADTVANGDRDPRLSIVKYERPACSSS
jgi:hypothetical protein